MSDVTMSVSSEKLAFGIMGLPHYKLCQTGKMMWLAAMFIENRDALLIALYFRWFDTHERKLVCDSHCFQARLRSCSEARSHC